MNKRLSIFTAFLLAFAFKTSSEELPVTFNLDSSSSLGLELSVSDFLPSPDTSITPLTGTMEATINIEPTSGDISQFSFTGGTVSMQPLSLELSGGFGLFATRLNFDTSTITLTPTTLAPPGLVDTASGQLNASEHNLVPTTGIIATQIRSFLVNETQIYNVDTPPDDANIDPDAITNFETLTIASTLISSSEATEQWSVTLSGSDDTTLSQTSSRIPFLVTQRAFSQFSSTETVTVSTDYGKWLLEHELPEETPSATLNNSGIPYSLLHAFDLGVQASGLPLQIDTNTDPISFQITTPEEGLRRAIDVRASENLETAPSLWPIIQSYQFGQTGSLLEAVGTSSSRGFLVITTG